MSAAATYDEFLARRHHVDRVGSEPLWLPTCLMDFQAALTSWSLRQGASAIFADCGLGKTLIQLVWAENVRRTNGRVLIVAPLAVSAQTVDEPTPESVEPSLFGSMDDGADDAVRCPPPVTNPGSFSSGRKGCSS